MTRGNEVESSFGINQDSKSISYLRQISQNVNTNLFICSWGCGVLLKDCKDDGDLLNFRSITEFENIKKLESSASMWLFLSLKVFYHEEDDVGLYGIFSCPKCPVMSAIEEMQSLQDPEAIKLQLCLHSRVANFLVKDWRIHWSLSMSLDHSSIKVIPSNESWCETFIPQSSALPSLAAVMEKKKVVVLFCVTARQESPFCSKCIRRKCHHFLKLEQFRTAVSPEVVVADINDFEEEVYEPSPDTEEEDSTYNNHYMESMPNHIQGKLYGYNFQKIVYPFCDSPHQQKILLERISGLVNIPASLVPKFDPEKKCKHQMNFNISEESIIRQSKNLLLFTDLGQRVFSTEVFARPSLGPCQCLQRYDGHEYLIWNLGSVGLSFAVLTLWYLFYTKILANVIKFPVC